jgi:hypothetical protein
MQLRFVAAIPAAGGTPTTRLNLHDPQALLARQGNATWHVDKGYSFPPPSMRRSAAATMLVDGERFSQSSYANRTLHIPLVLRAPTADAQATSIHNLVAELNRPNNILMWQPDGASQPVFFRTFRHSPDDLVEHLRSYREAKLDIPAEPFAYGSRVDLGSFTINNDPAAGSNGLFFDITSGNVKGDVETPLIIRMPASAVYDATLKTSLFATKRRGTPSSAPFLVQAESCTLGTGVTLPGNDAAMSGAGSNYARYTPSGSTNAVRLTTPAPTSGTDLRGAYRLLARYRKSVSGDTFTVQAKWANGTIANTAVTLPTGTAIRYADLGIVQFPAGADPVYDGYSNTEIAVSGTTTEIWVARTAGTGNLDFDFLLYVPADETTCYVQWNSVNDAAQEAVLDGARKMAYLLDASDRVYNLLPSPIPGAGFPMVVPGTTNRICFVRDVTATSTTADTIGGSTALTVSYYPRYLYGRFD